MAGSASEAGVGGYAEFRRGWPVVLSAMLGIGLGLSPVPFYTIGMLAPELARAFGWSFGQVMQGLPIMVYGVLVASPLVGWIADRAGVRPVALTSVVLFSLAFMSFGLGSGSLLQFYATWLVMAFAGAGTLPVTWTRAVNSRFDRRKGLALGLSLLGTGLFGYLVKPFAAWLIAGYGWRATYVVIGALPLLITLPVAWLGFHDVGERGRSAAERRAEALARRAATPGLTLAGAIKSWRFWVLGLAFLPISFAVGGPVPNMENILKTAGFGPAQVVGLASLIGLSVIFGRILGGWLIDRLWAPAVAFVLLSAPAAGCWMLARGGLSYEGAAASIVMIGFAAGVEYDLMAFLVARYFGMKRYSAIYGLLYGFFSLGAGFGPVYFGKAFDRAHSYAQPLVLSAGLLVLGGLLLLTLGRYRRFEPASAG